MGSPVMLHNSTQSSFETPSPTKLSRISRETGVHAHLEALGLQTQNAGALLGRPVFSSKIVLRLYREEVGALFGILCRDNLDRNDPNLFDPELNALLTEFGPLIWPKPGEGDRQCLRSDSNLEYLRDTAVLKQGLRNLILSKRLTADTDIEALINKRPGGYDRSAQSTPKIRRRPSFENEDVDATDDSDGAAIGTTTRRRARASSSSFSTVELRLYRRALGGTGATIAYGSLMLSLECTTLEDCFGRINGGFSVDCSALVFELPADMSYEGDVRVDRSSHDGEATFQGLREIIKTAKRYPGEPQYHSIEVRVEL